MIKVMIADDELLVRVGLKSAIDWNLHGFEIVAEVGNGRDGLQYLLENKADILLTDIKMPVMDGIELLREIKRRELKVKSIVLSCHDEYDYVREALKLGAMDYLLKLSLSSSNLLALLNEIKKEISINSDNHNSVKNSLIIEEKWLKLLFKYDTKIFEELILLGSNLRKKKINVMAISIDWDKPGMEVPDSGSKNILKDSVKGILNNIINDYANGDVFEAGERKFVAVINPKAESREYLKQISLNIQNALKTYVQLTVSIGISETLQEISQINTAYRQAYEALSRKIFWGNEAVIFYSDIHPDYQNNRKVLLKLEDEESLSRAIHFSKTNKVIEIIDGFFEELERSIEWNNDTLYRAMDEILYHFSKNLKIYGRSFEDIPQYKEVSIQKQLKDIEYLRDIRQWFAEFVNVYFNYVFKIKESTQREDVTKAVEYIISNYNTDLSLSKVAGYINMSENYFSHIFKRVTGESFTEFITKYRIERAKEMLRNSDFRINEIAEKIGFENVYYFSNVFKKCAGASPIEFRKGILKS